MQSKFVSGEMYFAPASLYSTWWNACLPEQLQIDKESGEPYFPDVPFKNTVLGQLERHPQNSSWSPFLQYKDIDPFSLICAAEGEQSVHLTPNTVTRAVAFLVSNLRASLLSLCLSKQLDCIWMLMCLL